MQVKKDSKHFLFTCIILYFYTKGYCLLFWLRHILLYRTATRAKAASPLCFKADSGHFSFTSSSPHFSCRIETETSIRRTRLLPDLRPIVFPTMRCIWLLNGISFLPLHPPPKKNRRYPFSPDVLPTHLPEWERSCVGGRTGLSCFRTRCGLFRLDFFATAFYLKSPYRFSLQS